jgi:hypothetical protein
LRDVADILGLRMRRSLVVARARQAVALVAISALAASCSSASNGSAVVVTPSAVVQIAATYSTANNRSNAALSKVDQALDEQGSALAIDDAGFTLEARAGFKTADGAKYYPFSLVPVYVAVPRQVGYPARFVALLITRASAGTPSSYACAGGSQVDAFVKDSSSAPWRVALEPEVTTNLVPKFASGSDGFAPAVGQAQEAQASRLPGNMVAALQTYARTGRLSDGITRSDFGTPSQCWNIDNLRADEAYEAHAHVIESISVSSYTPSDLSVVPLASEDGVLALFSVRIEKSYKPEGTGEAITWPHSSSNPFADAVPAGYYSSVTVPEMCEIAEIDPPASAGSVPTVVGALCSPLVGSGKRASAGQRPTTPPASSGVVLSQRISR